MLRISASLAAALLATTALPAPAQAQTARHRHAAARADHEPDAVTYGRRDDVLRFAAEIAEREGLDREALERALAQARYQPAVARLIMPPRAGSAKNWAAYRGRFVEPERVRAGASFWQANAAWLAEAESRYGVPADIVVGIVGVETFYGRVMGDFRILDALATLTFDFPTGRKDRSPFFREELAQFLKLTQRDRIDPLSVKGSYAGAMGLPQFMPGSLMKHAVDFDGDGRIDLARSTADAIGSVAAYLAAYGWQRGQPTHFEIAAPVDVADRAALLVPDILPSFTPAQLAERGAQLAEAGRTHDGPLALVELQNGSAAPSYVAGTQNFYAVTRYNWSSYYAMAVIELGRAVAGMRGGSGLAATQGSR
jgi:membrane-bound lytic murein transglycosylase B